MNELPEDFKKIILSQFQSEAGFFFESLSQLPVSSIRLNPLKPSGAFVDEPKVPWCTTGRILNERPSFTFDPLFHAGAYYVQENSSMFLAELVRQLTFTNPPLALDLCAAPGGKSTVLLDTLPANSLLVSNEIIKSRVSVLTQNLMKWGRPNVLVSNNDPRQFANLGPVFDLILADVPCSGEGLWRRDWEAKNQWSLNHVQFCVARQERILADILPCLKPGGYLVYSTCTFNAMENEDQIHKLMQEHDLSPVNIQVPEDWNIVSNQGFQFRFLPHKVSGEGLFMAVLQKNGYEPEPSNPKKKTKADFLPKKNLPEIHSWLQTPLSFDYFLENDFIFAFPNDWMREYEALRSQLYIKHAGICMGKLDKSGKLLPEHGLALSAHLSNSIPKLSLSKEDAIGYLKRDSVQADPNLKAGWYAASFEGLALGWIKMMPNRTNNYYPTEYRILKDISDY